MSSAQSRLREITHDNRGLKLVSLLELTSLKISRFGRVFATLAVAGVLLSGCDEGVETDAADPNVWIEKSENGTDRIITNSRKAFEKIRDKQWTKPGKNLPVPTGLSDDPFHIVEYRGDGWRMWDSGPGLSVGSDGRFFWLDEKRVLFDAYNARLDIPKEKRDASGLDVWMYIWDTEKMQIERYLDMPRPRNMCYANGRVSLVFHGEKDKRGRTKIFIRLTGPLDNLTRDEITPEDFVKERRAKQKNAQWYPDTCRFRLRPDGVIKGMTWRHLEPSDSYLLSGSLTNRKVYPKIVRGGTDERTTLPFPQRDFQYVCIRYFKFKGASFLWNCLAPEGITDAQKEAEIKRWQKTDCLQSWWLWSDGRTESVCVPAGVWVRGGSKSVTPTANGLLIWSHSHSKRNPAGIWLYRDGELTRLVTGHVETQGYGSVTQISDDGCKYAFGWQPKRRLGGGVHTVRVLDVCWDGGTERPIPSTSSDGN